MTSPAQTPFTIHPATVVGAVTLAVTALEPMSRYYQQVIGLQLLAQDAQTADLGVAGQPIVRLVARPNGRQHPRATGLYHLAILLPSQADLGHWLKHYIATQQRMIDGAGDHLVSEALYLSDPEGNGLEIYRDRPRHTWEYVGEEIKMDTLAVDLPALIAAAPDTSFTGLPAGARLGHVHLQVNDIPRAVWFYRDILGFDYMTGFPSAAFLAAGGYHHHIGLNTWRSRAAAPPPAGSLGLVHYTIVLPHEDARHALLTRLHAANLPITPHGPDTLTHDPAGNALLLTINHSPIHPFTN